MKRTIILNDQILSDVVQKHQKIVFGYPKDKIWNTRGVSLARRIEKDPTFKKHVEQALDPQNLKKYIVAADDAAPTRCIDGRIVSGWSKSVALQNRPLGPKVAGGTVHAALTHRIVDTEHLNAKLLFEEDIRYVVKRFKQIGIGYGGHIDDNQTGANTGCGAVDNINLILERILRTVYQEQLRGLAQFILGDAFDGRYIVNEVIGRILYLDALKPSYMPKENNDPHGEFLYKQTVMKTLRAAADKAQEVVPSLSGPHNEVAVVLNFVPGTTIDTDRFSFDNKNQIQVFGWDVWHMYEEARRLYEYEMYKSFDVQLEAISNRMKYVTTRTLLGISTTMVLTDGSLRLVTVSSDEA